MSVCRPDRLEVGIQLVQAQSTAFAQEWELGAGAAELIEVARAADEAGLLYVGVCDHTAIPRRLVDEMRPTWFDPFATLGLLAGVTSRVRLLTHVLVPATRHPLHVASASTTVDHLSGGRLVLGVGAGHVDEELAVFDVPMAERGERADEAIAAICAAMAEEWPTVDGPTWSFDGLTVGPRPVQRPRPPVWIGGSSPRALRRTAEMGEGWLPQGTPLKELPAAYDQIRRLADERGRGDVEFDLGANGPWLHIGEPPDAVDDRRLVAGSPDRIAGVLRRWIDAGADHLQVAFPLARSASEYADQIRQLGADVLPLLLR